MALFIKFISTSSGEEKEVGRATLKDGKVTIESEYDPIKEFAEFKAQAEDGKLYSADDGYPFLIALPNTYRGSALWAEVAENDEPDHEEELEIGREDDEDEYPED